MSMGFVTDMGELRSGGTRVDVGEGGAIVDRGETNGDEGRG